jgi:predicted SAM-dependent methyltransferase
MTNSEWANNMLQDQQFLDVFKEMEDLQMLRWANSPVYDYDERQEAYTKLTAIREVMAHIVAMADDRKINAKRWKIL